MRARIKIKGLLTAFCCAVIYATSVSTTFAQCAMCRASIEAAGSTSAAASETFNIAILVLLIPPVLIFCAIFFVAYRYGKGSRERAGASYLLKTENYKL